MNNLIDKKTLKNGNTLKMYKIVEYSEEDRGYIDRYYLREVGNAENTALIKGHYSTYNPCYDDFANSH